MCFTVYWSSDYIEKQREWRTKITIKHTNRWVNIWGEVRYLMSETTEKKNIFECVSRLIDLQIILKSKESEEY